MSVIVAGRDDEGLRDCLAAIRAQTHQPVETIVVDDPSADRARDRAVASSSGEILFFVDPCIAPAPDAIACAVRLLRERPDHGCVRGIPLPQPGTHRALHDHYRLRHQAGGVRTMSFALAAMRRTVYDETGPIDGSGRERSDIRYGARLTPRHPILLSELVTGRYGARQTPRSVLCGHFRRALLLLPTAAVHRRVVVARIGQVIAVLAAALAVLTAPLAAIALPFALLPIAFLLTFAVADRGLFAFARARGCGLARFAVMHFLVSLAIAAGAALGTLRWLVDANFGPSPTAPPDPAPLVPALPPNRRRRTLIAVVSAVAVALALWLASRDQDWPLAAQLVRPRALPVMLLAVLADLAGLALAMVAWRVLLVDTAGRIGYAAASRIYFVGVLTQKLPGRVWGLLTHIRLGRAAGFPAARMVTVYALNLPVVLVTAAVVASTVAPGVLGGHAFLLVVPILLTVGMYARPQVINLFVGRLLLLVGRVLPGDVVPTRAMRVSIVVSITSWLVSGLHLWALAILLGARPLPALPACVGGFALAMLVSSLALFLPDGWGAREVAMVIPLAAVLPLPVAGIAAVASRLVTFAAELAGAALATAAARVTGRREIRTVEQAGAVAPERRDSHV